MVFPASSTVRNSVSAFHFGVSHFRVSSEAFGTKPGREAFAWRQSGSH